MRHVCKIMRGNPQAIERNIATLREFHNILESDPKGLLPLLTRDAQRTAARMERSAGIEELHDLHEVRMHGRLEFLSRITGTVGGMVSSLLTGIVCLISGLTGWNGNVGVLLSTMASLASGVIISFGVSRRVDRKISRIVGDHVDRFCEALAKVGKAIINEINN